MKMRRRRRALAYVSFMDHRRRVGALASLDRLFAEILQSHPAAANPMDGN